MEMLMGVLLHLVWNLLHLASAIGHLCSNLCFPW